MIEFKNVSVVFDGVKVIKDFSLTIPEGRITVIAGRSGSGKTVLMKTAEGLIEPASGTVLVDGVDIFSIKENELNEVRKKMALLFQSAALFDSLNVFQNIAFPLVEHSRYSQEQVAALVNEKLALVGLENVHSKMPAELSGGMKKRAALARAIILDPKYIIYDEPTTGLDPLIAEDIINLILELHQKFQHTAIIITHDVNCIDKTADNMVVIDDGVIKFAGDYNKLKETKDPYCKQFVKTIL
ncbi:MAG: ATP-binding cassette domain-containing protein [Candidatus Cloacimonetes bacterium]|nr:ATP-binding cassette domain-containing protein [Candidatus Cloacimonadota bacterium]